MRLSVARAWNHIARENRTLTKREMGLMLAGPALPPGWEGAGMSGWIGSVMAIPHKGPGRARPAPYVADSIAYTDRAPGGY